MTTRKSACPECRRSRETIVELNEGLGRACARIDGKEMALEIVRTFTVDAVAALDLAVAEAARLLETGGDPHKWLASPTVVEARRRAASLSPERLAGTPWLPTPCLSEAPSLRRENGERG
jgi:hypothetical protein